ATTPPFTSTLSLHDALPISFNLPWLSHTGIEWLGFHVGSFRNTKLRPCSIYFIEDILLDIRFDVAISFPDTTRKGISQTFEQSRSEEHTSELQSRENLVCRL